MHLLHFMKNQNNGSAPDNNTHGLCMYKACSLLYLLLLYLSGCRTLSAFVLIVFEDVFSLTFIDEFPGGLATKAVAERLEITLCQLLSSIKSLIKLLHTKYFNSILM